MSDTPPSSSFGYIAIVTATLVLGAAGSLYVFGAKARQAHYAAKDMKIHPESAHISGIYYKRDGENGPALGGISSAGPQKEILRIQKPFLSSPGVVVVRVTDSEWATLVKAHPDWLRNGDSKDSIVFTAPDVAVTK